MFSLEARAWALNLTLILLHVPAECGRRMQMAGVEQQECSARVAPGFYPEMLKAHVVKGVRCGTI